MIHYYLATTQWVYWRLGERKPTLLLRMLMKQLGLKIYYKEVDTKTENWAICIFQIDEPILKQYKELSLW